jgi:hypothetical protein
MAKNKKKRKPLSSSQHKPVKPIPIKKTKTHLDECYAAARKIFRFFGEDPALFDSFSKNQKQGFFFIEMVPPRVAAKRGHSVPRYYVNYVQEELVLHMRRNIMDESTGLTLMDMFTYGQTMILTAQVPSFIGKLPDKLREALERINARVKEKDLLSEIHNDVTGIIRTSLMLLSQANFRVYGLDSDTKNVRDGFNIVQRMLITAHESQSLRFTYRGKERTGYRLATGQFMDIEYCGATIPISKIFPSVKKDRLLNIYVQSHALHRFKERINTLYPIMRNQILTLSIMYVQKIVRDPNGKLMIACVMPPNEEIIAYFPFTIDGDNLLVLTLLPLLSREVPEGRVLCERLNLTAEDEKYLGMDKLSFFYDIDIEQIPVLKKILLDELNLGYIRGLYNSFKESKFQPFDEKKTLFVKNFFRTIEEQSPGHADILDEITAGESVTDDGVKTENSEILDVFH